MLLGILQERGDGGAEENAGEAAIHRTRARSLPAGVLGSGQEKREKDAHRDAERISESASG